MERREFLLKSAAGVFTTSLAAPLPRMATEEKQDNPKIIYRVMGRTGLKVPVLSFGVMNTDSPELLKKALEMGLNHLDTANGYLRGNSETSIGRVLKETGMRDKVYVATKIFLARDWNTGKFTLEDGGRAPGATAENFNRLLEQSLGRLQSDHADILYVHACDNADMVNFETTLNAAVKAKEAGKTRFIGVSAHSKVAEVIRAAVDARVYDVVEAAFNFQRDDREEVAQAIAYAKENGVAIVAMKTQGGARREGDPAAFNHKAALKWVLSHEGVSTTIPGMTTFEQLALNYSVMADLNLTDEEKKAVKLSSAGKGGFCQDCRACVSQCPKGVEIPNLMRAYLYSEGYGNPSHAEWTLDTLPAEHGLLACRECSACSVQCRNGLNIGSRVKKLKQQFSLYA
ncbi:aldo/keto reductase [bacterium]|nr:aldo/keto reductase [bacterium]